MKTIYKVAPIAIVLFLLLGCERVHDCVVDSVNYEIVYKNLSGHKINIKCDSEYYQFPFNSEIASNDSCKIWFLFHCQGEDIKTRDTKAQKLVIPQTVTVVYDDEYSITFSRGSEMDNLCNLNDYKCVQKSEQDIDCCYTFTNEDYEYAKTYGEKMEN